MTRFDFASLGLPNLDGGWFALNNLKKKCPLCPSLIYLTQLDKPVA